MQPLGVEGPLNKPLNHYRLQSILYTFERKDRDNEHGMTVSFFMPMSSL